MNPNNVADMLSAFRLMPFFPQDENAFLELVRFVGRMCHTEEQVRWLVDRTLSLYDKWPGPMELRAVFCTIYKPKDGVLAYSNIYREGIPPVAAPAHRQIAGPELIPIPEGHIASADPELDAMVKQLAEAVAKKGDTHFGGKASAAEIAAAPKWLRKLEGFDE